MRDFTLKTYKLYIEAIQEQGIPFLRFDEFMSMNPKPTNFCLVRHDVDRKPQNALKMAMLENIMNVKATYYFRTKPTTFKRDVIEKIAGMGHEVGYHYESLSDANGDIARALQDFESNLAMFREVVPVKTISMHGRPLKPYDNRDIWRIPENHTLLSSKFNLLGEAYLDIDYSDIAYINDTGRNWTSDESNRRDKVSSQVSASFKNGEELLKYFKDNPHPKMVFQIHPERWTSNTLHYIIQFMYDVLINITKNIIKQYAVAMHPQSIIQ